MRHVASDDPSGLRGYDAELQRHSEILRLACAVQSDDHVLDIGCGAGQTTRQAARTAVAGSAVGIDTSSPAIHSAREIAEKEGLGNVTYEHGDAQVYRFPPQTFDLAMSRFGTMFFEDPVEAFTNIGRALRPSGRLVMLVWQDRECNEWDVAIRQCIDSAGEEIDSSGPDAFSLADPRFVKKILQAAGFDDVAWVEIDVPVYYGPHVAAALNWVRGFTCTNAALERLAPAAATRVVECLTKAMDAHLSDDGVWFNSRSWIITANRHADQTQSHFDSQRR